MKIWERGREWRRRVLVTYNVTISASIEGIPLEAPKAWHTRKSHKLSSNSSRYLAETPAYKHLGNNT